MEDGISDYHAHHSLGDECVRRFCSKHYEFEVYATSSKDYAELFQDAPIIVLNDFAHLHGFIASLKRCYNETKGTQDIPEAN